MRFGSRTLIREPQGNANIATSKLKSPKARTSRNESGFGRAVSRILSAPDFSEGENHLSQQPIPGTRLACARLGAGNSEVPYLALHPMGFSVPRRSLDGRWSLTPPFHPYPRLLRNAGGIFSVALSVGTTRAVAARVYLSRTSLSYAASRPVEFGLSSLDSRRRRSSALPNQRTRQTVTPSRLNDK